MPYGQVTKPPGDPAGGSTTTGSGATDAVDLAEVAPDADAYVMAMARPYVAGRCFGFKLLVSDVGVPGDGSLVCTARLEDAGGLPLTDHLPMYSDTQADPVVALYNPAGGTVLKITDPVIAGHVAEGQLVSLVWRETGTVGTSVRPKYRVLGLDIAVPRPDQL